MRHLNTEEREEQFEAFPATVDAMLRVLDEQYPEPINLPTHDVAAVMFRAGQRSVLLNLKVWQERASKSLFKGD